MSTNRADWPLWPLRSLLLLATSLACNGAVAIPGSGLDLYARLGWAHDDNLLRVPDGAPGFDNQRADSWRTGEFGALYDKHYRRQRLSFVARVSRVTFQHFRQLDYTGREWEGNWHWQLGKALSGKLGASAARTLAPYTDFLSNERNLRTQRRRLLDLAWTLHPRWQLRGAFTRDRFDYALPAQAVNNRQEDLAELEGRYVAPGGSALGLVLRRIEGRYPQRRPSGLGLAENADFRQHELKLRVDWKASAATSIEGLAGYARRSQGAFGSGGTRGLNGRLSVQHAPRAKLRLRAAAWREFAPLESELVSHTLNRGLSLGASWTPSTKIALDADLTRERRRYAARSASDVADVPGDTLRSASIKASWAVKRKLTLSAALSHQARTGSSLAGTGSFRANTVAVNLSLAF
jgi:exopolysaccharide biosynthesis operon protein EpsL